MRKKGEAKVPPKEAKWDHKLPASDALLSSKIWTRSGTRCGWWDGAMSAPARSEKTAGRMLCELKAPNGMRFFSCFVFLLLWLLSLMALLTGRIWRLCITSPSMMCRNTEEHVAPRPDFKTKHLSSPSSPLPQMKSGSERVKPRRGAIEIGSNEREKGMSMLVFFLLRVWGEIHLKTSETRASRFTEKGCLPMMVGKRQKTGPFFSVEIF